MTSISQPQLNASQQRDLERYQNERVLTAPPQVLISLLFERAISDLDRAIAEPGQLERSVLIRHAQDVVLELRCCLDMTQGEMAQNLDQLYAYVDGLCLDAFVNHTIEPLTPARQVIADLHAGWQTIL